MSRGFSVLGAVAGAVIASAASSVFSVCARADVAPNASAATQAPSAAPSSTDALPIAPPAGFERKRRLTDEDYAKKKEGGYFTGLPLANYDPNTGFGFGARAYYFWDGKRESPLFAYEPYKYRFFAQAFARKRSGKLPP